MFLKVPESNGHLITGVLNSGVKMVQDILSKMHVIKSRVVPFYNWPINFCRHHLLISEINLC